MALPPVDPMPPDGEASDAPAPGASEYAKAGRTIRHALADQDDEALGQAICDLVKYDSAKEPDEDDDADEGPSSKPNLALILAKRATDQGKK